jgi:beta-lactamase superfamily II metal-dependent hydrolase
MKASHVVAAALLAIFSTANAQAAETPPSKDLQIYFLDMMGGASTLIVTPLGQSVLIDTGSLEPKHRDAERIYAAARHAGLKQIDCLVTTHFHSDHFGGILQLTKLIPVKKFVDKGHLPPESEVNTGWFKQLYPLYQEATGGKVETIKAGDDIPLKNDPEGRIPPLRLHCVAAEKKVEGFDGDIDAPVPGHVIKRADDSDNARSIALVLSYGKFQFFAGGDITWNVEHHLAAPKNVVGEVDLYQVTHHGLDQSNNPVLLQALKPTVCIAMNGPRKGIEPNAFRALREIPGLKALFQIHYNTQYGDQGNTELSYIANGQDPKKGNFVRVFVLPSDVFAVSIGADGPQRVYAIK